MIFGSARAVAAALAAAALSPWPALAADVLADAEREIGRLEQRLVQVEAQAARPEEGAAARAAHRFADGETQYLLGDWVHAAVLLSDAISEPAFRAGPRYPDALFYLADSLRRQGACGAARKPLEEYLALPAGAHRGEALAAAIECAVQDRRAADVERLVAGAGAALAESPPAEVLYLQAKALYQRTDLAPEVRRARAMAAFSEVPPPYLQQAAYFQAVLHLEEDDLAGAAARFEACHAASAHDDRQREVQDLCALGLGRVHAAQGHAAEALDWYARVPRESPHFVDALYETAWSHVKAGQDAAALRTASVISDLAPESQLAPEATVLQGHLLLRLGRYADATEAYSRVINAYAPIRDEVDAILTMHEDPVGYFNELIGRQGEAFDVAAVLPPVALRWAATHREVADALKLVRGLDAGRQDVDEANVIADRMDALLARGNGLDAFPPQRDAYAAAEAVANAAVRLEGRAADAALAAGLPALGAADRARVDAVHARRAALAARVETLPRTAEEIAARAARMRAQVDRLEAAAFRLALEVQSARTAIEGSERWLEQHRAEIYADPQDRADLNEELRKHREVVAGYEGELRAVRLEIAVARDAAGGADALAEEARLRAEYVALLAEERAALEASRGALGAGALVSLDRAAALSERLAGLSERAGAVGARVAGDAARRAGELRERVRQEKLAVAANAEALEALQADARQLVGRVAYRSFQQVRDQFYRLVLKADVGLVDVAWTRKRVRLEKIQQLSAQKATELEQLDRDYRELLREVD